MNDNILEEVIGKIKNKYGNPIGEGSTRIVFDAGRWVVKVPNSIYTFDANYNEQFRGDRSLDNEIYAACRLFHIKEVPVLYMEKVTLVPYTKGMPNWVDFIDCQQVGLNRRGKLVAYDYGNF